VVRSTRYDSLLPTLCKQAKEEANPTGQPTTGFHTSGGEAVFLLPKSKKSEVPLQRTSKVRRHRRHEESTSISQRGGEDEFDITARIAKLHQAPAEDIPPRRRKYQAREEEEMPHYIKGGEDPARVWKGI